MTEYDEERENEIREYYRKLEEETEKEINGRILFEYTDIYPEDLKPHPVNVALYGEEEVDKKLVESILQKGLVEPLIINLNNEILSGHRRWLAVLHINKEKIIPPYNYMFQSSSTFVRRKVKCQVATFRDDLEEKQAIIEYNKRRPKRYSQLYNEIEILDSIYSAEFEGYLYNKSIGSLGLDYDTVREMKYRIKNSEKSDYWDDTLEDSENVSKLRHLVKTEEDQEEKLRREAEIEIRKRIIKEINSKMVNVNNIQKLQTIGRAAKKGHKSASQIMQQLDRGKLTIHGAYILFWLIQQNNEYAYSLCKRVAKDIIIGKKKDVFTPTMAKKAYDAEFPKEPKKLTRAIITDADGNRITRAEAKRQKRSLSNPR